MPTNSPLFLASDHAGYHLKLCLVSFLEKNFSQFEVIDLGPHSEESVDYPVFGAMLCRKLLDAGSESGAMGILCCGTGIGVSIVANRFVGIRAAVCRSPLEAQLSRSHNHSNVLCLGARILEEAQSFEVVRAWLSSRPEQGRHARRVGLIDELSRG